MFAWPSPQLLDAVARLAGVDQVLVTDETLPGESRSTFAAAASNEELVVKLLRDGPQVLDNQRRLIRLVGDLRRRGYPAPSTSAWGNRAARCSQSSDVCQARPCSGNRARRQNPTCSQRCCRASLLRSNCSATPAT